jgi:hypothetical protein
MELPPDTTADVASTDAVELTPTATARNKKRVRPKLRRRVPTRWKRRGELVAVGETWGREREVAVSLLLTHASTERARLQKNERRERATGDKREDFLHVGSQARKQCQQIKHASVALRGSGHQKWLISNTP